MASTGGTVRRVGLLAPMPSERAPLVRTLELTKGEVGGEQYPVPPEVAGEPAFLAVYPADMIEDLPCLRGMLPDHGSRALAPDQG